MKIIAVIALAMVIPSISFAETATFQWTASPSSDVSGYRLYWKDKATGNLSKLGADISGKNTVTASREIPVIEGSATFAVVAKAFDQAGNESVASNEATKDGIAYVWKDTTAPEPPGVLQVLQQIAASLDRIAQALDK